QLFVHRNKPNRPHISSDIINVKERGSTAETKDPRQNLPEAPHLFGATRVSYLKFFFSAAQSFNPSGVPSCASAPPVKGCLGLPAASRKRFFCKNSVFFETGENPPCPAPWACHA
ncbi:hypothetical protein, partial [Aliiroseovarius subalbicans]|uniref:hypothetical protein n=1 Tax=Aliiroseovarius subalbicans TaxID=2925840 RepID=UPI001F5724C6